MSTLASLAAAMHLGRQPALKRTICEVLRELGREAKARGDIEALRRLVEATEMAKRMHHKLVEYKAASAGDEP
jgi:hypothetical protein